jgi:hypothetical protein
MSIARRSFLKSATMSTLSAGLALGSAHLIFSQARRGEGRQSTQAGQLDAFGNFRIPMQAQRDAIFYFGSGTFTPYVGDIFEAPNSRGETVPMKLMRVSDYKATATTRITTRKTRQPQGFSLTFTASEPLPPFTSIHKVSHPALGTFDLFLTSREADDGTFIWEAVFNHML